MPQNLVQMTEREPLMLTITTRERFLVFTQRTRREMELDKYRGVRMFFSEIDGAIVMKLVTDEDADDTIIPFQLQSGRKCLRVSRLLRLFSIEPSPGRRVIHPGDESGTYWFKIV